MNHMKDLLVSMYALVYLFHADPPRKEVYASLKNPNLKPFFAEIPGFKQAIDDAIAGDFDFADLGSGIKQFLTSYSVDPTSKASVKELLSAFGSWMRTSSASGMKFIERSSASSVFPPWAAECFITSHEYDQKSVRKKLHSLLRDMTGEPTLAFTSVDAAKEAKSNYPELYREFLAQRALFNKAWKDFMANYVRGSGAKTVPYSDLTQALAAADLGHTLPAGFLGNIDAVGRWYSPFDELLTNAPQVSVFPKVFMNPEYEAGSGDWVYLAKRVDGSVGQRGYAKAQARERTKEKFNKVRNFVPIVDKVRRGWLKEVKQFDEADSGTVASLILELMFQFSARIGHFVAVKRSAYAPIVNGFRITYHGKDGVLTKHKFVGSDPLSKFIVNRVAELADEKGPKDFLFTYLLKNGERRRIQSAVVRRKFRELGAHEVSVHKLRTYNGTKIFRAEMERVFAHRVNLTFKEAMGILKKMATKVGVALNHIRTNADGSTTATPATALSAYIDLQAQIEFFQHYGLPLPKSLEKANEEEDDEDSILSAFIDIVAAETEAPKPIKMAEVPEPVGPKKESDEKKDDDNEDGIQRAPNAPAVEEVKPTEEEIEEDEQDRLKEDAMREDLKEQAEGLIDTILDGGDGHEAYQGTVGGFDNMLVKNRFPKGEAP